MNQVKLAALIPIAPNTKALIGLVLLLTCSIKAESISYTLAPYGTWTAITCSGDGATVVASEWGSSSIFISTNSGATWVQGPSFGHALGFLTMTPDSKTLVGLDTGGSSYSSHDLGITWTTNSLPTETVRQVVISSDGRRWACIANYAVDFKPIYVSSDSGVTWQPTSAPVASWVRIASSGDGSRLAAVQSDGPVYTSTNYGVSWVSTVPTTNTLYSIVSSADGTKLVTLAAGGAVYSSTNAGVEWVRISPRAVAFRGPNVASSADANVIAGIGASAVEISTNSGELWNSLDPETSVFVGVGAVAMSADGSRVFAASSPGLIFTSPLPPPALTISLQTNSASVFWQSNQVGFVLESTPLVSPASIWTPVTNDIYAAGYRYFVTNRLGQPAAFFRLHKL